MYEIRLIQTLYDVTDRLLVTGSHRVENLCFINRTCTCTYAVRVRCPTSECVGGVDGEVVLGRPGRRHLEPVGRVPSVPDIPLIIVIYLTQSRSPRHLCLFLIKHPNSILDTSS